MTRLRVRVKDDAKIDDEGLKAIEGVMGIVHDRTGYVEIVVGPGKCRKCADICRDMGIPADAAASTANDWQTNKAAVKAGQKQSKVKELFKTFGDIFIPPDPGRCGFRSVRRHQLPDRSGGAELRRHPRTGPYQHPAGSDEHLLPGLPDRMGRLPRSRKVRRQPPFWAACWA